MIVKRNLNPRRVLEYIAAPMAWAALWAIAALVAFTVTDDRRLILPFPAVATLGAALAIFVAFRNNSAFARWNEARSAWQTVLVASRTLTARSSRPPVMPRPAGPSPTTRQATFSTTSVD